MKTYSLGKKFKNIHFTRREAECMVELLKEKTIDQVAMDLSLSSRTVEFFIRNMQSKLNCRTKFELIELVQESDFIKSVDF